MEEASGIYEELAKLREKDPSDNQVQDLVEQWRNHISANL